MLKDILLVGAGGFAGSVLRYLASVGTASLAVRTGFPAGTFIVNAVGSLLIGIFFTTIRDESLSRLLIAGFCGGFTTFSAFSLESLGLLRDGHYSAAALNILGSVAVCILFVWLGCLAGKQFVKTI